MFKSDKKPYVIIRALLFVAAFVLIFAFLEALTYDHNLAFDGWAYIYQTDIDIMIMGSSQAGAFDAAYITEQTGKNTVILTSGAQGVKQIYFNLLEILKYQQPELVVVEEFSIIEDTLSWMEEQGVSGLALANLDGMRMSPLKLRAVFSTLGFEGYGVFHIMREAGKTERFIRAVKDLPQRLKSIFEPEERYMSPTKGTILYHPEYGPTRGQYEESLTRVPEENFALPEESVIYMDKIVDLCAEKDVKLEFIKTPLIKNQSSVSGHPVIAEHLKQTGSGVDTYNLMDGEYGLDMVFEDYTDVNHVSESGMRKLSDWFIAHLDDID